MIAELGLFSLILALLMSIALTGIPFIGLIRERMEWIETAPFYVKGQFVFIVLAYGFLSLCFLQDDFSVVYVLNNSSIQLPWFYKMCAVWGGHEGSMLLWVAILSFWTVLVASCSSSLPKEMQARVLVVLGGLSVGFILFLLCASNPFIRQFQVLNTNGRDLNPLLQDPGFLFHPPMLYMGYVGFSVAFAFAIAALWAGKVEPLWCKWTRPWTLAAWCCLTAGITLGSWWAYRELGWGGWWFWDPVENASFMPWLCGTALIHSLAVTEKRQQFKAWTMLLAIIAFSLSLVGTFLVRSGVLTSVHAFAVDPQRGLYILGFLLVVIGGSLLLFLCRGHSLRNTHPFQLFSRESALLLNNVFLVTIMFTVLMGTTYPLLIDGLGLGKLSVGAPYFNAVFVPLMVPVLVLMGLGIHLKWNHTRLKEFMQSLMGCVVLSLVLALAILLILSTPFNYSVYIGIVLALWIISTCMYAVYGTIQTRGLWRIGQSFLGMIIAHLGVAVSVLGIVISTAYGVQDDVRMAPGMKTRLLNYTIEFIEHHSLNGANYRGTQAKFRVSSHSQHKIIYPEKRIYHVGQMAMTESAIDVSAFRDIYIALGEQLNDHEWSLRLYYKPFIRWIWGGGFMILLGGVLALCDRRYYRHKPNNDLKRVSYEHA